MKWILALALVVGATSITFGQDCKLVNGKMVCSTTPNPMPVAESRAVFFPRVHEFVTTVVENRPRLLRGQLRSRLFFPFKR